MNSTPEGYISWSWRSTALQSIEVPQQGGVVPTFQDGSRAYGDLLIDCEGCGAGLQPGEFSMCRERRFFLRMRRRTPRLRTGQFNWSSLGALLGLVMATVLVSAMTANGKPFDFFFGLVVILFGFVLVAISLW